MLDKLRQELAVAGLAPFFRDPDFVAVLAETLGVSRARALETWRATCSLLSCLLAHNRRLKIRGVGTFTYRFRQGRRTTSPFSNVAKKQADTIVPVFVPSAPLRLRQVKHLRSAKGQPLLPHFRAEYVRKYKTHPGVFMGNR